MPLLNVIPKTRRCKYFWPDGTEKDGGCLRSSRDCKFIHPRDPEWDAYALGPTDSWASSDSRWNDHRDERRPYDRDSSSGRRRSPASSYRAPSSSPAHSSVSRSYHDSHQGSLEKRLGPEPPKAGPSRVPLKSPEQTTARSSVPREEKQPLPTPPATATPATGSAGTKQEQDISMYPPSTRPRTPQETNLPPPPDLPPSPSKTTHSRSPPPPLPMPPSSLDGANGYSAPILTTEEQTAVWQKRLDLLVECVQRRQEYARLSDDLRHAESMLKPPRNSSLTVEQQERWKKEADILSKRAARSESKLNSLLPSLVATGFWPALSQPDVAALDAKYKEMQGYVTELKGVVSTLDQSLRAVLRQSDPDHDRELEEDGMDVDTVEGEPPRKRKRTADGDDGNHPRTDDLAPVIAQIEQMHIRLGDLENNMIERDNTQKEELRLYVAEQVDAIWSSYHERHQDWISQDEELLAPLREQVDTTGKDIEELSSFAADSLNKAKQDRDALEIMRKQQESIKEQNLLLEEDLIKAEKLLEEEEPASKAAFEALELAQKHQPVRNVLDVDSLQYLLSLLHVPLENAARQKFEPLARKLREELEGTVEKQKQEVVNELGGITRGVVDALGAIREQIMDDKEVQ